MKQYAKSIIYFTFPLIIGNLCACRSAKSGTDRTQADTSLSQLERIEHNASGTISSQVKTKETEKGNTWRIVCNFDTSLPVDPQTGLPPTSSIEIEGSETETQTSQEDNESARVSDNLSKQNAIDLDTSDQSEKQTDNEHTVFAGIDKGIKTGLIIGIPIILIILIAIIHARKKNTSK